MKEESSDRAAATDGRHRISRRGLLEAAGAVGATGALAGCYVPTTGTTTSGTTVQFAADSEARENQDVIERALHESGLPEDVHLDIIAGSSDVVQQQYTQWLSAELSRPSLLRMDSGWTTPFIARDLLANLSDELPDIADRIADEYFDATVQSIRDDSGDIYGVPFFSDFGIMLYRKDAFEDAGIETDGLATEPMSWAAFSRAVDEAREAIGARYGYTFQARIYVGLACCNFVEFMTSWGGSYFGDRENLFGPIGERPVTVDDESVLRSVRMVRTFLEGSEAPDTLDDFAGPISPQAVLQWSEQPALAAFTDGDAVAARNWPFSIGVAGAPDAFGEDLGVMPMPYGIPESDAEFAGMGGSRSALGGWNVVLNPNAAHPEAAKEVLRAMSADRFYLAMLDEIGYVPPKPALLDSSAAQDVETVGRYLDTIRFAGERAVPRPATVVWPQQSPRISQQVNAAFDGQLPVADAMGQLAETLTEIENGAEGV